METIRCVAAVRAAAVSRDGKEGLQQMQVQFTDATHLGMNPEHLMPTQGIHFEILSSSVPKEHFQMVQLSKTDLTKSDFCQTNHILANDCWQQGDKYNQPRSGFARFHLAHMLFMHLRRIDFELIPF